MGAGATRRPVGPRSWAIYGTIMVLDVPTVAYGCTVLDVEGNEKPQLNELRS